MGWVTRDAGYRGSNCARGKLDYEAGHLVGGALFRLANKRGHRRSEAPRPPEVRTARDRQMAHLRLLA
eukprot:8083100-Pyramimonas_sp.AAC.2